MNTATKDSYELTLCFHEYIMEVDQATFEDYIKISGTNNAHDIHKFEDQLVTLLINNSNNKESI